MTFLDTILWPAVVFTGMIILGLVVLAFAARIIGFQLEKGYQLARADEARRHAERHADRRPRIPTPRDPVRR